MFEANIDGSDLRSKASFPDSYWNQLLEKAYLHIIDVKWIVNVASNVENDTGPRLLTDVLFVI